MTLDAHGSSWTKVAAGWVLHGFRPSQRPVARRLRTRAAFSVDTITAFSNCATAPNNEFRQYPYLLSKVARDMR